MKANVHCFLPFVDEAQIKASVEGLKAQPLVSKITLLSTDKTATACLGCDLIHIDNLKSSATMKAIAAASAGADYILLYIQQTQLVLGYGALERFVGIARDTKAAMLYSDHYSVVEGKQSNAPVIDYQFGSLRDDFDFGSLYFFNAADFVKAAAGIDKEYSAAGLYDLRLRISRLGALVHINEYLYTDVTVDNRASGQKIFDYVDPRNRASQIEMEEACTAHLKEIGGYLEPVFEPVELTASGFENEASVIIPVRNRVRTILDAIDSALDQKTDFKYNVIVIDNHSTDGTTEAIEKKYADNPRVIHIKPERTDLGIGGCWNTGVAHPECGKFAIQLDSDDVYSGPDTLSKIVKAFYDNNAGMVVGTYMLTDFNKQMIPPGVIDHKEWTPENGRNNALRINGLGAPRAFYTPLLREIRLPNTSYGEDYAVGLAVSRHHQIGRVYDVLYLCRRWEDNSDAALDINKMNGHNTYKDRIRTWELQARIAQNKAKK
mgnify:CR=1 FL=1